MLYDPKKSLSISIEFQISSSEIGFLRAHAVDIYRGLNWSHLLRRRGAVGDMEIVNPLTKQADGEIVEAQALALSEDLLKTLDQPSHLARLAMEPGQAPSTVRSPLLELMFAVYQPDYLGVLEYQGPIRSYDREQIGGLNLQIQDTSNKKAQHALYNTKSKYTGVKTEMAQSYIREILAERAGVELVKETTLMATLDELFNNFFPGKKFLGPIPTKEGALEFPVQLESGKTHDINELSSGEKEVLLGYLRLRNSAPRNSIVLLDEPELHLNPRLARSLPRFYEKHLSKALSNQIWLVTHSDAILREAVQEPSYAVFHMQPAAQVASGTDQADKISAGADLENAIIDLVGDLASYNPRSKVVLLEGETSEIDAKIITQLFPAFADRVSLVSLGSKKNVRSAHIILEKAAVQGRLDARFFAIVDRDFGGDQLVPSPRRFSWDVYHIENYLLSPSFIKEALHAASLGVIRLSEEAVLGELRNSAVATLDEITRIKLREQVNARLVGALSLGFDSSLNNVDGFSAAANRSLNALTKVVGSELQPENIAEMEKSISDGLRVSLANGTWMSEFRGRNILRHFVGVHGAGTPYEHLRNLLVARMRESQYEPPGMKAVIASILNA
ncbi:hypothetical protein DEA8626_02309 [Defluviimonas aquaemixtae]|uniref:ATPase AAA-type core domain-containing protein n=2 Tax=Albidovulum aquaemixtae TaxID=1542388 RepID=A0A2R8B7X8_9RHOB|nr:hypothetical protein DEA8626_02309 [Defluviimonas aquaemixtae]